MLRAECHVFFLFNRGDECVGKLFLLNLLNSPAADSPCAIIEKGLIYRAAFIFPSMRRPVY